ncbi:MAG: DnaT-like ssDNA-binding protein [Christensenellaceae bacterium]
MTENVDTYVTTTEADQIISETYPPASPLSVSWVVLTETEKERFLAVALERMENLAYKGDRAYYFQSLQFPVSREAFPRTSTTRP